MPRNNNKNITKNNNSFILKVTLSKGQRNVIKIKPNYKDYISSKKSTSKGYKNKTASKDINNLEKQPFNLIEINDFKIDMYGSNFSFTNNIQVF